MEEHSTKQVACILQNVNVMIDKKAEDLRKTTDMHHP